MKSNDICRCGSGKPYARCHRTLDRTRPRDRLSAARRFYIDRWVVNASAHARGGHYDWMTAQVPGPVHRLLDIGVGEGSGLVAMLRRYSPHHAVALEENPECIRRTRTQLIAAGVEATVVTRMAAVPGGRDPAEYGLAFNRDPVPTSGVTIVVTDPLFDAHLAEDLRSGGPFDLITAWLLGSHEARENSRDLMALGHMTAARYRLLVQNAVYELADKLLAVGGRLQVVDRLSPQHPDLAREELRISHTDQAMPTTLEVADIALYEYREVGSGGVKLLHKDCGQGTPAGNAGRMILASVVSVKR